MWLSAPEGFGGITVEQISYVPEITAKGRAFFRAADHLVPAIIATGLGFEPCEAPEGTDLPDLPKSDPLRDSAIANTQWELLQLRATVDSQKSELSQASAAHAMMLLDLEGRNLRIQALEDEAIGLRTEIEELRELVPTTALRKWDDRRKAEEEIVEALGTRDGAVMR